MSGHGRTKRTQVTHVTADHAEARIIAVMLEVPFPSGGEVIVDGDQMNRIITEESGRQNGFR